MTEFLLRVYTKVRFFMNHNIHTNGKPLLSPKTEVSVQGLLCIGNGVIAERGVFLAARKNAELHLGDKTYINRNTNIVAKESIKIGHHVDIGPNVCIFDHDHKKSEKSGFVTAPIVIGDHVWIGANCTILKGVTIGENTTIAAGSVITHDVPDNCVLYQKRTATIVKR